MSFPVQLFDGGERFVRAIEPDTAAHYVIRFHYLHRRPPISHAFGLVDNGDLRGVCTFGIPPSRHLQMSACPSSPDRVIELNRLWVHDDEPRNTESWFVSRCVRALPPLLIVSYADTAQGHVGYIYRAMNWRYAGWTDMDRAKPRLDYVTPGKHTRDAYRHGFTHVERRKPKMKYWTASGSPTDRRVLAGLCGWPSLDWRVVHPSLEETRQTA